MNRAATVAFTACAVVLAATVAEAHAYRVQSSFGAGRFDGVLPYATVVRGANGDWFGTTANGGTIFRRGYCRLGCGTIYRMNELGARQTIHDFSGRDGEVPVGPLLAGTDGWLYGTATGGGREHGGTVYRLRPDGSGFEVLHAFEPRGPLRGSDPQGPLLLGQDHKIYGITVGGSGGPTFGLSASPQWAIAYRLDRDGANFTVLHGFLLNQSGGLPTDGLIQGSDGRLYGTTGISLGDVLETVFSMRTNGSGFRVLRVFRGESPFYESPGVIEAQPQRLFGVTTGSGRSTGTVFSMALNGSNFRTLHHFSADDGERPLARLTAGGNGMLYGTASEGGHYGFGTIFEISYDGARFTVLHHFRGPPGDGERPLSTLTISSDGEQFFGTTQQGGANPCLPFAGCGTVFTWSERKLATP